MSLNAGHDPDPDEGGGRFPEIRQAGRIGDSAGRRYATRATTPSITGLAITSDPGSDNRYVFRDKIEVTVTFSEAVTVTGSPRLTLLLGSPFWIQLGRAARNADFARQPELRKLVFAYTVAADDSDPDGVSIAADSLSPNGGTIVGSDDTAGRVTHDALAAQPRHLVDTIAPTVLDIFVDGRTLSIGYSEALDMASVPAASRFRVHVDNAVRSVSDVSVGQHGGHTDACGGRASRRGGRYPLQHAADGSYPRSGGAQCSRFRILGARGRQRDTPDGVDRRCRRRSV